MEFSLRMGRISFLNVLPIYHALEAGIIEHDYEIVSGPPALLNNMMSKGELQVSSCSCFEYAKNPDNYYLIKDLSIGSRGPVMSVLLMSSVPLEALNGREILISGQSHTSVALLKLLMSEYWNISPVYKIGRITSAIRSNNPPVAFLAIGDEALHLRNHPAYVYRIDLAEAWREWTGMAFIFGLWVISRKAVEDGIIKDDPGEVLREGLKWGMEHMDIILDLTAYGCPLSREELRFYYQEGLLYDFGIEEQKGLNLFYQKLALAKMIPFSPQLYFL